MKCLLCGSENNNFIFTFKGKDIYLEKLRVNDFSLKWFQCYNCSAYFSEQYGGIERLYNDKKLYDAQYDKKSIKTRFKKIMSLKEKESDNAFRVKRIKSFHRVYSKNFKLRKKIFKILDVGAGTGVFLANFLDDSYKGYALEINKIAANHMKEELSIRVYTVPIGELYSNNKYDIVTINKVLEHIEKPLTFLKSVRNVLDRKGIVYVELPDTLNFKYYGDSSEAFTSGHYMVFNPESIFYLSQNTGFEILKINRIIEPSGKITIYSFLTRKDNEIL